MNETFNARLLFFTQLRRDPLVRDLGTEATIRELVDTIVEYKDLANRVAYLLRRQQKSVAENLNNAHLSLKESHNPETEHLFEEFAKDPDSFLDQRATPIELNFSDVQAIAYTVGTYQDRRSLLQRLFRTENPLDSRVKEHLQLYKDYLQTGKLNPRYFDEDVIPHIIAATNPLTHILSRARSLNKMFEKSVDYLNRQGALLRLAKSGELILAFYAQEDRNLLEKGFRDYDMGPFLTANDKRLTSRQIKKVAGYLQRQATIDGLLFKTLYLASLIIKGYPDPKVETERTHQEYLNCQTL